MAVNTPSPLAASDIISGSNWEEPRHTPGSYSLLLGSEEEELQAMLKELLAAFPTQTTESENSKLAYYEYPLFGSIFKCGIDFPAAVACDLHHPLVVATSQVGSTIGEMVEQVAASQGIRTKTGY